LPPTSALAVTDDTSDYKDKESRKIETELTVHQFRLQSLQHWWVCYPFAL